MSVRDLLPFGRSSVPVTRDMNPILAFQDEVNKLFSDFFGESAFPAWFQSRESALMACPAMDVKETDKEFKVMLDIPGMEAKDVQVSADGNYITIKGEKKRESKEEKEGYIRQERFCGSFQRIVALPENANFDKIDASYKNGVLTLSIPKKAETQAHEKRIEIKQAA